MSRRECWGVFHREKGWFVDEEGREFAHNPVRRASFTLENAKVACEKDEYPRRFWRVSKPKVTWREMSDLPDSERQVLVSDGVDAIIAYYRYGVWRALYRDDMYSPEPDDKWCELPTR